METEVVGLLIYIYTYGRICQIFNPSEIKDENVNLRRLVSAAPSVGQLTGGRHQDTCELMDRRCFYAANQIINRNIIL